MIKSLGNSRERHLHATVGDELHLKFMLLGDSGVGKSSLLTRYILDVFNPETIRPTIVADFRTKAINLFSSDNKRIKLQIWDTVGSEQFQICSLPYFKNVHMFMIVYDVTKVDSFKCLSEWIKQIKIHGDNQTHIVIIGNKCDNDRNRTIFYEEGEDFAEENKCLFYETSACHNLNLDRIFLDCADICSRSLIVKIPRKSGIFQFFSKKDSSSGDTSPSKHLSIKSTTSTSPGGSNKSSPRTVKAEQTKRMQEELDFFYEFQGKCSEFIEISGMFLIYGECLLNVILDVLFGLVLLLFMVKIGHNVIYCTQNIYYQHYIRYSHDFSRQ
jgi:small GTP-binding protein